MKKFALLFLLVIFAGTAAVLLPFWRHVITTHVDSGEGDDQKKEKPKSESTKEDDDKEKKEGKEEDKKEEAVVKLDKEGQERIGLGVQELSSVKQRPQIIAYGLAADPATLAALDSDMVAADAALQASRAAADRARSLFESNENVSRKAVETAASQYRTDQSRARALRRRLSLEWGTAIAALDDDARSTLLDELIKQKAAVIRVDVPGGESVREEPTAAKISVLGREDQPITAASVAPASSIDPKAQAQGFLLQISDPPFPVRPGVAVTAFLELPGDETEGVVIPRSAIVRYAGETWAYVQSEDEEFARRRVPPGHITETGLFVSEGFKSGEKIVVTGAQTLLSSEMTTQGGGGD